jgi:hypothetical protein
MNGASTFLLEAGLPGAAFVALAFMPGRKAMTSQTASYTQRFSHSQPEPMQKQRVQVP